ncbi:MAG: HlyC/CorC family transporter [Rhizobacter sp.]|nr:HlyC/CorC family transporter [Chlorobiales bacterium]
MEHGHLIGIFVLLLVCSAFFSGTEVAFFSLSLPAMKEKSEQHSGYLRLVAVLEKPKRLLITILIGNLTANAFAAIVAAVITERLILRYNFEKVGAYTLDIAAVTFLLLIFGEITPKIFAAKNAERFSLAVCGVIAVIETLLYPVSEAIFQLTKFLETLIRRIKGGRLFPTQDLSDDDIKAIAEVSLQSGSLESSEKELIDSVLDFREKTVREVMTPRTDMNAISTDAVFQDAVKLVLEESHSRIPLYDGDLDTIVGIIYAKDLVKFIQGRKKPGKFDWKSIARQPIFVPESKKLDDLLRDFQHRRMHIAIVVDEFGGTSGLVTLEDVIEEIIGEVQDAATASEVMHKKVNDHTDWFDASMGIDEVSEILGKPLRLTGNGYDTLGGFILSLTEDIPDEKEHIKYENLDIEIDRREGNRITSVLITRSPQPQQPESQE